MTGNPLQAGRQIRHGLFWFLAKDRAPSRFAAISRRFQEENNLKGIYRLQTTHADVWKQIQRLDPELQKYGFDFFPRGHVEYSAEQERWLLILDQKLHRGAFVAHIVIRWNIPREKLLVRSCCEYRSIACIGPPT